MHNSLRSLLLSLSAIALCSGCESAVRPLSAARTSVPRDYVTGEALAALDDSGHYRTTVPPLPSLYPMLAADRARHIVDQIWREFGWALQAELQSDRGAPLDVAHVVSCGTPVFVESPYEQSPDSTASLRGRILLGPRWRILMCSGESVQAIISIGALAVVMDQPDPLRTTPTLYLAAIHYVGVPDGAVIPLSAEAATIATAEATGARVDKVPYLVAAMYPLSPWYSAWSVHLDRYVHFVRQIKQRPDSLQQVFFGNFPDYGVRSGPRWPRVIFADSSETGPPATLTFPDRFDETSGRLSLLFVTYQLRPAPAFFIFDVLVRAPQ